jgi:hypothetical protein
MRVRPLAVDVAAERLDPGLVGNGAQATVCWAMAIYTDALSAASAAA